MNESLTWTDFSKVHMRVGAVLTVEAFPQARNPSYIITVDFGPEYGVKKTSAQLTQRYALPELIGKRIIGVVNFPPKQIGPIMSEFLILGAMDTHVGTAVLEVSSDVAPGTPVA